ncbi:uncharacterized protein FFB20_00228 [Fusarium fujikuroi]|nr:uncharacterized protein FFB20_00228 [Fusarium fujikuroi]
MDLLLAAKQAQKLNSKKKAVLKPVFKSFIAPLKETFPAIKWDYRQVESQFTVIRDKYRIYQEIVNITGSTENKDKRRVSINRQQEADLRQLYPQTAARIIKDGLGVNKHITVDAWHKIFSNDRPAGRFITEAGNNDAFAHHQGMPPPIVERAVSPSGSEQEAVRNRYPAEANSEPSGDNLPEEVPVEELAT